MENSGIKVLTIYDISDIIEITINERKKMSKELANEVEKITKDSEKIRQIKDEITEIMKNMGV